MQAVHGTKTLDEYVAHMSRDGTFVDEPEVRATSHIISRPLLIFSGDGRTAKLISSINMDLAGTQIMLYLQDQHYSFLQNKFKMGDWVLVTYDDTLYPGEVVDYYLAEYKVNTMEKRGAFYVWPSVPDSIFYPESNILKQISPPVVAGSRGQ